MKTTILKSTLAVALCAASLSAMAATNWNLTNSAANEPQVTGWKASNNGSDIYKTSVGYWAGNGIGVGGETSGNQHALDNQAGFEVALLSFDDAVRLESVRAGFTATDSDIFVMAFTGAGSLTATQALDGGTFANLTSRGWTLIGNYANIGTATKDLGTTSGAFENVYSSFWLIGVGGYAAGSGVNSGDFRNGSAVGFDQCSGSGGNRVCGRYDYLKLASVGGTIKPPSSGNVPEPGSLALAGIALLGMVGMRRRKNTA
ncbi:PEP-CTERM sorting domain-containing protein [Thauera sp. SDU_THAU2]|uniref:PEP-CTERM sorting domain-containing protein n=1 Tax=Thauera sp. SDU_THAU2 TaxID=3136633 RepID=UPI00311F1336